MTSASRVYVWTAPLIALGCLLVAGLDLDAQTPDSPYGWFVIGCALGTMFGQTTIAAFWTALGPPPLYARLLASLLWLTLLSLAFVIGFRFERQSLEVLPLLGPSAGGQWVLVQVPLWLLAYLYGLRLRFGPPHASDVGRPQFGLGQLMIFTLGIAVILGIARGVIASGALKFDNHELPVFLFLAAAAVLISLPLALAALMSRLAWLGVPVILGLIALATAWELPLLTSILGSGGRPNIMHLVWINFFTSAWVLAFVVVARLGGGRLAVSQSAAAAGPD
jgi:hypothetical protein